MSTMKQSKARKALEDVARKYAALTMSEREHAVQHEHAQRRASELSERFTAHVEQGALAIDGTAGDEAERKLHAELAKANAAAQAPSWRAKAEGFRRARLKLDADRQRLTAEHFDDLAADLVHEATKLRDDTRAWLSGQAASSHAALSERHASLAGAWIVLERDAGMQQHTRLDVGHEFPVQIVGDTDALAVPRAMLGGDPTITSDPAPAVFAGGGGVFPLDENGN